MKRCADKEGTTMKRDHATRTGLDPREVGASLENPCPRRGLDGREDLADRMRVGVAARAHVRRGAALLLALGSLLLLCAPVEAGAPTDQLKASVDEVIRILEDPALKPEPKTKERRDAIRKAADKIFDFQETAKRALGPHWQSLGEKDRQEFVSLFADLLERSYISKIERYSGEKIAYAGDSVDGDLATVKTRFTTKQGAEVPVDYRTLRHGDRWMVYDVNVEGVSLVNNYRTQFNKIIQTSSYQNLVAKMKSNDDQLSAPGASKGKDKTPGS
jgi:phospholipid transport system substrate-binding protein